MNKAYTDDIFDNPFWRQPRPFSEFEAWLDLLRMADDTGCVRASLRVLGNRWGWTTKKTFNYINRLVTLNYINKKSIKETAKETAKETPCNVLIICNRSVYNVNFTRKETAKETAKETVKKPTRTTQKDTTAIDKRKSDFYSSLIPFLSTYPKTMLREFYNYWSETNRTQTKMRFELEKTWEVSRRLATWANRNNTFRNNGTNEERRETERQQRQDSAANLVERLLAEDRQHHRDTTDEIPQ